MIVKEHPFNLTSGRVWISVPPDAIILGAAVVNGMPQLLVAEPTKGNGFYSREVVILRRFEESQAFDEPLRYITTLVERPFHSDWDDTYHLFEKEKR